MKKDFWCSSGGLADASSDGSCVTGEKVVQAWNTGNGFMK